MNKELFVETINTLKKQSDHDRKCSKFLNKVFPDAFGTNLMYDNHILVNQLIKILQVAFNDKNRDSWIEYFIYELDFGAENDRLSVYIKDKKINLSSAENLYDFLVDKSE